MTIFCILPRMEDRSRSFQVQKENSLQLFLTDDLRNKFQQFHIKEIPLETLVFLLIVLTTYVANSILGLVYVGLLNASDASRSANTSLIVSFVGGILSCIIGWATLYCKYVTKYFPTDPAKAETAKQWQCWGQFLQNILLIIIVLFLGIRLYSKISYGQCTKHRLAEDLYCNNQAASNGYPLEALLGLIIVPMLYPAVLRDTDWAYIFVAWLLTNFFLLASSASSSTRTREKISFFIYYFVLSGLQVYSNQRQNIRSFLVQQQLATVISQNEEMAEELRANELRHMIGNVAHDLKTPLASFVSGLDMIADIAQDGLKRLSATSNATSDQRDCFQAVLSTVQNNRNVNNFMMMTINRCIDYTKASRGLKLVPKYETIDLVETLALPFKCMHDVSQRVRITLEPISTAICSHLITDKQWLQENILCLLSNAVKYSSGGTVNARVILTTKDKVGAGQRQCDTFKANGSTVTTASLDEPLQPSSTSKRVKRGPSSSSSSASSITPFAASASTSTALRSSSVSSSGDGWNVALWLMRHRGRSARTTRKIAVVSSAQTIDSLDAVEAADQSNKSDPEGDQRVVLVEVEDTGIGMTEESMAMLFNAFKQAQRLAGGTGLGLFSLARRIEALGGAYGVRKRSDGVQGSLFWFTIPYRPDEMFADALDDRVLAVSTPDREFHRMPFPATPSPPSKDKPSSFDSVVVFTPIATAKTVTGSSRALRILIVDDSASIQKMMSMMLRRHGHHVDQAENGADAVAMVTAAFRGLLEGDGAGSEEKNEFVKSLSPMYDVVLMDLQMPVMDGLEAMRRIRSMEQQLCSLYGLRSRGCSASLMDTRASADDIPQLNLSSRASSSRGSLHLDRGASRMFPALQRGIHQMMIGVSANSDTDTMKEALAAGADAFISKPFSIDSFYQTYEKCSSFRRKKI